MASVVCPRAQFRSPRGVRHPTAARGLSRASHGRCGEASRARIGATAISELWGTRRSSRALPRRALKYALRFALVEYMFFARV